MDAKIIKLKDWGCDVDSALARMLNDEELLMDCVEQVSQDPAFEQLGKAIEEKNVEVAFDAAHTLKGILANTGISPLYDIVVKIVEPLRAKKINGTEKDYQDLLMKKEELLEILS